MTTSMAQKIRQDLISSLGLGGAPQEDPWAKLLFQEAQKTSLPGLEQALIGRGLGGSTVYKEAITDLLSKLGTQSALGSQQYKLGNLQALQQYLQPQMQFGQNLQQLQAQTGLKEEEMAQQLYTSLLPLMAKYSGGQSYGGLGSLIGGLGGLALAPFTGGMSAILPNVLLGAQAGGTIGGAF